jgi:hypothetical protein
MTAVEAPGMDTKPTTVAGMTRLLDELVGRGNYTYDPVADVWVTPNPDYTGPGRGFILLQRGGFYSTVVLPDALT